MQHFSNICAVESLGQSSYKRPLGFKCMYYSICKVGENIGKICAQTINLVIVYGTHNTRNKHTSTFNDTAKCLILFSLNPKGFCSSLTLYT